MYIVAEYRVGGGHTHVDLFTGPDKDHVAKTGSPVFLNAEWKQFIDALQIGVYTMQANGVDIALEVRLGA